MQMGFRKYVRAIVFALVALFAAPAGAQDAPKILEGKYYLAFPVEAAGHDINDPAVYVLKPFDTKDQCEQFRSADWFGDETFKTNIAGWAQMETDAHAGKILFHPTYCRQAPVGS